MSATNFEQARASEEIEWAHREMAANLLRIIRGAGKPYDMGPELARINASLRRFRDAFGFYPPSGDIRIWLDIASPGKAGLKAGSAEWELAEAERTIQGGILQMVASQLVQQPTQYRAGYSEMHRGFQDRIEALVRYRRETGLVGFK